MALHVCNCGYSTKIKCNYQKHIAICKKYGEPDIDNKYIELQQKYEEEIASIKAKYEQKLQERTDAMKQRIASIKARYKYKRIIKDEVYLRAELIKECKKYGLKYRDDDSIEKLRKITNKNIAERAYNAIQFHE